MLMRKANIVANNNETLRELPPEPAERPEATPGMERSLGQKRGKKKSSLIHKQQGLTIATLNLRGRQDAVKTSKFRKLATMMNINHIDLVVVQESRLNEILTKDTEAANPGFKLITNGNSSSAEGLTLMVKTKIGQSVEIQHKILIQNRASFFTIKMSEQTVHLIGVHVPNQIEEKLSFLTQLDRAVRNIENLPKTIVLGDFNFVENSIDRMPAHSDNDRVLDAFRNLRITLSLEDGWRKTHSDETNYTFHQSATGSKARLDRIYINKRLMKQTHSWEITSSAELSDHDMAKMVIAKSNLPEQGQDIKRLRLDTLQNPAFMKKAKKLLKNAQTDIENYESEMTRQRDELSQHNQQKENNPQTIWINCKKEILNTAAICTKEAYKNKTLKLRTLETEYRNKIKAFNEGKNANELNDRQKDEFRNLKSKIDKLNALRIETAQTRAKAKYNLMGEKCTKYWFALNKPSKINTVITELKDKDNKPLTKTADMIKRATEYHSELQQKQPTNAIREQKIAEILENITVELDEDQKRPFMTTISHEEVLEALKATKNGSSPGQDGIPYELYKSFTLKEDDEDDGAPDIIKILKSVFNDIQEHGVQSKELTEGIMFLLYKKKDKDRIENYRPLTLLNTDYKVLTKILANKLGKIAPDIIHKNQSGFIPGRSMYDSTRLTQLLVHYCEQNGVNGCIVSLDQEKAYDKIAHDYLWKVLEKFGFPRQFINLIKTLYEKAETATLINGMKDKAFKVERGVRQGDPMSCILYDLAIEPLASALRNSQLKGIKLDNMLERILTQLFADDTTVIMTEHDKFKTLQNILDLFCIASTAKFNLGKTEVLPVGYKNFRIEFIRQGYMGNNPQNKIEGATIIKEGQPMRILGCWIGNECTIDDQWQNIMEKQTNILKSWSKTNLSMRGKEMILKQLIQSRAIFLATVNGISAHVTAEMTKIMKNFLWNDKPRGLMNWKEVISSRTSGGLGIPDIKIRAEAIEIMWLKKFLATKRERPDWAYIADKMIFANLPEKPIVNEKVRIDWILQSWQEKRLKSTIPEQILTMLKIGRKYNVAMETRKMALEVKGLLPIWYHFNINGNYQWNKKSSKCLRDNHRIITVEELQNFINTQEENLACENIATCIRQAQRLLDTIPKKYNPKWQTPMRDHLDHTPNRIKQYEDADFRTAEITYNPDITERGLPHDSVRIFNTKLTYKRRTKGIKDIRNPAYRSGHSPEAKNLTIVMSIDYGKDNSGIGTWEKSNSEHNKSWNIKNKGMTRTQVEILAFCVIIENTRDNLTVISSQDQIIHNIITKIPEWENNNYLNIEYTKEWKTLAYLLQRRAGTTSFKLTNNERDHIEQNGAEDLAKKAKTNDIPKEIRIIIPTEFKLDGVKLQILTQKTAYAHIIKARNVIPGNQSGLTAGRLEDAQDQTEEITKHRPKLKAIWLGLISDPIRYKIGDFIWKILHDRLKIGPFFNRIPTLEHLACCKCGDIERIEHLLLHCQESLVQETWKAVKQTWLKFTDAPWIEPTIGIIRAIGGFRYPETNQNAQEKANSIRYKIFITESIYNIWLQRNRRVFDEIELTKTELHNQWKKTLIERIKIDYESIHVAENEKQGKLKEIFTNIWCTEKMKITLPKEGGVLEINL